MVDTGKINEAKNRLYDLTGDTDVNSLEVALLFYSYLNDKTDDFLETNDFSRDEIKSGLENVLDSKDVLGRFLVTDNCKFENSIETIFIEC